MLFKINKRIVPNDLTKFYKWLQDQPPNEAINMFVVRNGKEETIKGAMMPVTLTYALQPFLDGLTDAELNRRRAAAVTLSGVVQKLDRADLLRPHIPDLLSATFNDSDEQVREYAGRVLQHTLHKIDHKPTLTSAARSLAVHLDSKDPRARRYSAIQLYLTVRKIKDPGTLKALRDRISISAATKDPDKHTREHAERAVRHIEQVLKEQKK